MQPKNGDSPEQNAAHLILKKRREELGLTQKQVSDIASMDIRMYQRLESGERKLSRASFRTGVALADILKIDVHDLVSTQTVEDYQAKYKIALYEEELE